MTDDGPRALRGLELHTGVISQRRNQEIGLFLESIEDRFVSYLNSFLI